MCGGGGDEEWNESYIGETERSFKARFLEHKRPSCTSSEVSRHLNKAKPENDVHIDEARILDRDPDWFTRGIRESIYIRAHKPNLNRDGGEIQPSSDLDEAGQVTRHVTWPSHCEQDSGRVESLEFDFQYGVASKIYKVN